MNNNQLKLEKPQNDPIFSFKEHHVVITGTGRCGTTFLVELLTYLGLDTGFTPQELARYKLKGARAGLEKSLIREKCPYIVKKPSFCDHAPLVFANEKLSIDHVFIPIRNLHAAAESRRLITRQKIAALPFIQRLIYRLKPRQLSGGLWGTSSLKQGVQENVLKTKIYNLLLTLSEHRTPYTLIRFPRLINDGPYLYEKLKPVLNNIPYEKFEAAFHTVRHPELVHHFNQQDY
jgi:hypothetical protein